MKDEKFCHQSEVDRLRSRDSGEAGYILLEIKVNGLKNQVILRFDKSSLLRFTHYDSRHDESNE